MDQRILEHARLVDLDQLPISAGHRVFVALAQEPHSLVILQVFDSLRVFVDLADVELDGAFILLAPFDQQLFLGPLLLEDHARQFHVEHDGDGRRHGKDEQQGKALAAIPRFVSLMHHVPCISATSPSVC